jgi:hypothetical protein
MTTRPNTWTSFLVGGNMFEVHTCSARVGLLVVAALDS